MGNYRIEMENEKGTYMIAFTTASSAAAFTTNVKDATQKLGIDKKLVAFATPPIPGGAVIGFTVVLLDKKVLHK